MRLFCIILMISSLFVFAGCLPTKRIPEMKTEDRESFRVLLAYRFIENYDSSKSAFSRHNNIVHVLRDGYVEYRIYGIKSPSTKDEIIETVEDWIRANPDLKIVYVTFFTNEVRDSENKIVQFSEQIEEHRVVM